MCLCASVLRCCLPAWNYEQIKCDVYVWVSECLCVSVFNMIFMIFRQWIMGTKHRQIFSILMGACSIFFLYISFLFFWVFSCIHTFFSSYFNVCFVWVILPITCSIKQKIFIFILFCVSDRHQYGILLPDLVGQIHTKIGVWRITDLGTATSKR